MRFQIGFTAQEEQEQRVHAPAQQQQATVKHSVVDVFFPDRHLTYSYYNDMFDLKCGDLVYVDGKMEGLRGQVVKVSYTFKIRPSAYKRVIGVVDTQVRGRFRLVGSHVVTTDAKALSFERVITWFRPPIYDEEMVVGIGDESFSLDDLSEMQVSEVIADRGYAYFAENRVAYLKLDHGQGRAIVLGSRPYEVEFHLENGRVRALLCDCYCCGPCKHAVAAMLQLKQTLKALAENGYSIEQTEYLAAVSKEAFFQNAIEGKDAGSITLE